MAKKEFKLKNKRYDPKADTVKGSNNIEFYHFDSEEKMKQTLEFVATQSNNYFEFPEGWALVDGKVVIEKR